MNKPPLVCDTSLLLYLGRIGYAELIPAFFEPVYVPNAVILELDMGRSYREDTINPHHFNWVAPVDIPDESIKKLPPNHLGTGERSVITYAIHHTGCWAGLDDGQARSLAKSFDVRCIGLVGILLKGKRYQHISAVRVLLDKARNEGFWLTSEVYTEALRLAGEHNDK